MVPSRILANAGIVGLMVTSLSGCFFDRSGIAVPGTISVEPGLFCPGDPVEVAWNVTGLPRQPLFCAPLGRDFIDPVACTSDAACPGTGATCYDGICCPQSVYDADPRACPTSAGCYPTFDLTVTGNPDAIEPPVSETTALSGSRTVTPSETTSYTLDLTHAASDEAFQTTATARMVTVDPATATDFYVGFACEGGTAGYRPITLDATRVSAHVRVDTVTNTSAHGVRIAVDDGTALRAPVMLAPGERTNQLAGAAWGVWSVTLSPLDAAGLRPPRCEATDIQDPWPDLTVEFTWMCAVDPEP